MTVEVLLDDATIVAAGAHSKWASRRKIDLAELIDEPWVLAGPASWSRTISEEIFRAGGISRPEPMVTTDSVILRARLIAVGPYLGMFMTSVLRRLITDSHAVTALPVDSHAKRVFDVDRHTEEPDSEPDRGALSWLCPRGCSFA